MLIPMDYPNDLSLSLGYDLPASPHGFRLIAQLVLSDLLLVQKTVLEMLKEPDRAPGKIKVLIDDELGSIFSWSFKESVLRRIKRYLLLANLNSTSNEDSAPLISLRHYVESVERQTRDLRFAFLGQIHQRQCHEKMQRLASTVENCAHHFTDWVRSFNKNENVLLFILQKRGDIITCFGEHYFDDLVERGFGSIGKISELLLTNFTQRGFNSLIPSLQKLISSMEYRKKRTS